MATFTAIKNKAQSRGALDRALDYVKQEKKTLWEERHLVTGWNCVAQSAYDEMMTTKRRFQKTDGRMFYQFVQSFDPAEDVTPQEVHAIGLELAQKLFPEFEVVVATHVDTDHLHNHLIVNSVSWKDGRKLHQNAAGLQRQRQVNDEICMAHGLQALEPPKRYTQEKQMRPGEYRSAVRGESWKFQLMNTIDLCMRKSKTKAEFVREMERRGYQVRWEPTRQCITYTHPRGRSAGITGCMRANTERRSWSVSSGSEQKCSIEELKERNLPPEQHPTAEEWDDLLALLSALYRLASNQTEVLKNSLAAIRAVHTQAEALIKDTVAIRQLLERQKQAGRKKERRLSLLRIHLPTPSLAWLWVIPILVALYALWPLWGIVWSVTSALLQ